MILNQKVGSISDNLKFWNVIIIRILFWLFNTVNCVNIRNIYLLFNLSANEHIYIWGSFINIGNSILFFSPSRFNTIYHHVITWKSWIFFLIWAQYKYSSGFGIWVNDIQLRLQHSYFLRQKLSIKNSFSNSHYL